MPLSESQLNKALEDARKQGLPHDWILTLDVSEKDVMTMVVVTVVVRTTIIPSAWRIAAEV